MSTECPTFGTAPKHVASLGHVEKQDKCSSVFWSDIHSHSQVMGNATLTRISSKLPVARSLPRPSKDSGRRSPKTSDVTECQTTSYHDPTCGEVCLGYCVRVPRHSHIECVPFCRTCGVTGTRAALPWLYFYTVSDVKRRNFSRAVKFFVEEPHHFLACLSTQHMILIFF